ncbi:MAG: MarR family transcriptional regulator [Pseudobdellovibrionaceae bacterium]|nr:MarR family transcriptional regulator [Pseudobdellovibrionaceae bacterium]
MKKGPLGGYLVAKVHNATGKLFAQKLKESNLSELDPSLANIVFVLLLKDGSSIKEIADFTSFGKSTLSNMLDRLESLGWLRRVHSKEDRRVIHIFLEKSPEQIHEAFGPIIMEMIKTFYKGFTKTEIKLFEDTLHRIMGNLEGV